MNTENTTTEASTETTNTSVDNSPVTTIAPVTGSSIGEEKKTEASTEITDSLVDSNNSAAAPETSIGEEKETEASTDLVDAHPLVGVVFKDLDGAIGKITKVEDDVITYDCEYGADKWDRTMKVEVFHANCEAAVINIVAGE